jgi:Holliday junction resolvase RusA-like endonuclease
MQFFLPMHPPRTTAQTQGRRAYKPAALKDAEAKLAAALAQHRPETPYTVPVRQITKWIWYTEDESKWGEYKGTAPDEDNLQKLLKDVMQKQGFYKNDALVASAVTEKFWGETPGIFIRVEPLPKVGGHCPD